MSPQIELYKFEIVVDFEGKFYIYFEPEVLVRRDMKMMMSLIHVTSL